MTNLGLLHYFLGFEVWQNAYGIFLCQKKYATCLLEKYGIMDYASISCPMYLKAKLSMNDDSLKNVSTIYHQLIGSLLYLVNTLLDLAYAMSILSEFSTKPHCSLIGKPHNAYCVILMVLLIMKSIIMGFHTLISYANLIGRVVLILIVLLLIIALFLVVVLFHGNLKSKASFLPHLLKQNTSLILMQLLKLYGYNRCLIIWNFLTLH